MMGKLFKATLSRATLRMVDASRKRRLMFFLLLTVWGAALAGVGAEAPHSGDAEIFLAGVRAYESGDYQQAVDVFSDLVARGYASGSLLFNLGNSYFKAGDLGRAILWYQRALKLTPGNPDLLYNLDFAKALTRDAGEGADVSLSNILFFWKNRMSPQALRILALIVSLLFWVLLTLRKFLRGSLIRTGILLTGFAAVLFAGTAVYTYYEDAYSEDAIVLAHEVTVRSGTDQGATELFRVHAGTRVQVERQEGEHALISLGKDRVGWVSEDSVALVRWRG